MAQAAWLELLSSLHFLAITSSGEFPQKSKVPKELMEQLLGAKPYLSEYHSAISIAWQRLKKETSSQLAAA